MFLPSFVYLLIIQVFKPIVKEGEYMNDSITEFLDLVDEDCEVVGTPYVEGHTKYITLKKKLRDKYCPVCHSRLHSHGLFTRKPNNPILQDGYNLDVTLIGRRWRCSNSECSHRETDTFPFVEYRCRNTKIVPLLIVKALKDIKMTCREVAAQFHVSDTFVHETFMRYIDPKRKTLPSIISIDEVYLNTSSKQKYALVIMDWKTGEIIDLLPTRRQEVTERYFYDIPLEERKNVKILVCDMYNPYINYTVKYFPNAKAIVDSFHVLQWLLTLVRRYIDNVKKNYQARDRKVLEDRNYRRNKDFETQKDSKEVYILKHAKWVLLRSQKNYEYHSPRYNRFLGRTMDTLSWETEFLKLDDNFQTIRTYKDMYEEFNESYANDLEGAASRLDELIKFYSDCEYRMFREFSNLLKRYREYIINSFIYIEFEEMNNHEVYLRRISNGPMESFNNIPSGLRTQSRGVKDFDYTRARILWSTRKDEPILIIPKSLKEVQNKTGLKRGPYSKHK